MSHQAPPELTPRAIVLAIVLAMILAGANAYLGLFAGMTIASAIPAAVVSMASAQVTGWWPYPGEQHCGHRRLGRDFHSYRCDFYHACPVDPGLLG